MLDLVITVPATIILLPVVSITAIAIWWRLGRPILFWQTRAGFQGEPFRICKFRTMLEADGANGRLLTDEERLTAFGRLVRSLSLDEIPQLLNVLRGDMSLVGPRPLLLRYWDRYTPEQRRRHDVQPGITGWAQVRGRNELSWPEKFACDVWYVDHCSLALDLRILGLTLVRIASRSDVSADGHATMPEFMGNRGETTKESGDGASS